MKILIVGPVGTGKTTYAKRISEESNIKYWEIDSIVHDDKNSIKRDEKAQRKIIDEINKNSNWIIEGVLRKNLYYLLEMADTIMFIDTPKDIRTKRIIKRFIKQKLHLEKCNYKPTLKMLKKMFEWSNEFEQNRDEFEKLLSKYNEKLEIITNL